LRTHETRLLERRKERERGAVWEEGGTSGSCRGRGQAWPMRIKRMRKIGGGTIAVPTIGGEGAGGGILGREEKLLQIALRFSKRFDRRGKVIG